MIFSTVEGFRAVSPRPCVLLDGCFDPLHAGHVRYLRDAKLAFPETTLVVAVASDADIRAKGRVPLLGQSSRCAVIDGLAGVDVVVAADRPTHALISALQPAAYVKGKDWEGRLPAEILTACALRGVQIVYLGQRLDSSSDRLRQWALADADASLDRLETFMAGQTMAGQTIAPTFDTDYFVGGWRGADTFTYDARKRIEGRHPKIVKECFEGLSVLDAGCGPGYFVRMLRELGMDAGGIDPSREAVALSNGLADRVVCGHVWQMPDKIAQLVICREVLEHVPVREIPALVGHLFRVARKFVYITTRFQDGAVFDAATDFETDPTHITCLSQPFLRSLCVLNGGKRRRDLEQKLDHQNKGRVLVYAIQ